MNPEVVQRWHNRLFFLWAVPGLGVSIVLALFAGTKAVLVWNLAISVYTVMMEHFLGARSEKEKSNAG